MPSNYPKQRLSDILDNITLIGDFIAGMDNTAFCSDPKTSNAVERCLERISEAAKKLGEDAAVLCPGQAWPELRALGNLLRHEYDKVEISRVWVMIEDDLPGLRDAVKAALARL